MKFKFFTNSQLPVFAAVATAMLVVAQPAQADIEEARAVVSETMDLLYEEFVKIPDDHPDIDEALTQILHDVMLPRLDIERFVRLILAKHYRTATDAQKRHVEQIFTEFLLGSFAKAVAGNQDKVGDFYGKLAIGDAKQGSRETRAVVPIAIELENNPIDILFRLGKTDDGWKVYDIVAEGVSFAINYRTVLNSEIDQRGLEAVIAELDEKLAGAKIEVIQ